MRKILLTLAALASLGFVGYGAMDTAYAATASKQSKTAQEAKKAEEAKKAALQEKMAELYRKANEAGRAPIPQDWQEMVKTAIVLRLKDPDSAQFKFPNEPDKFLASTVMLKNRQNELVKILLTWESECQVNAKNGFGGYNGFKTWRFRIAEGKVWSAWERSNDDIVELLQNMTERE